MNHDFPWHTWSEETFARARALDRPVLLHIGATWCHWCHVMDEDSYTHSAVARLIKDHFVAIRVDTDHRPDINERYNMGGWPTMAILDPRTGEVLIGRTYVPGHELANLLGGFTNPLQRWSIAPSQPPPRGEPVSPERVGAMVRKAYDPYHGGFGEYEKFPHIPVCEWVLDQHARGQADWLGILDSTLTAMASKGMYDKEEGGFFRYCTQDDWSNPHYEKMLEDHARLLHLYARAGGLSPNPTWQSAASRAFGWALKYLWSDEDGAFWGSQDADEGYYYKPLSERRSPPAVDQTIYAGWNGLMVHAMVRCGALWGRPGLFGLARQVGRRLLQHIDADGRVRRTLHTDAAGGLLEDQAQVAQGLLSLYGLTGDPAWRQAAERVIDWCAAQLVHPDGGFRDRPDGGEGLLAQPRSPLPANAALAEAAWSLWVRTSEPRWREIADSAARAALADAERYEFMATPAFSAAEKLAGPSLLIKVNANPALLYAALALPHPDVVVQAVTDASVPANMAMVCSRSACARPTGDITAVQRDIQALMRV